MTGARSACIAIVAFALLACSPFSGAELPGEDSGTDAASGSDAASPYSTGFCKRQPQALFLCDDFDVGPLGSQWSETAMVNGGFVELQGSTRSAPNALIARSTPATTGQAWAYLAKDLGTTTNHIVVGFDMRIETRGSTYAEGTGLVLTEVSGPKRYGVHLILNPNGSLSVDEAGSAGLINGHAFQKTPLTGEWTRIELDIDLAAAALRVRVDDSPTLTVDAKLAPPFTAGKRALELGLDYFTVDGWRVAFDNVTCDVR